MADESAGGQDQAPKEEPAKETQSTLPIRERIKDPLVMKPGIELFFGLVGPTGTNLDAVCSQLSASLKAVAYETELVSMSELIAAYSGGSPEAKGEYHRIKFLMREGTRLCEESEQSDFVARLALAGIRERRYARTGDPGKPAQRVAYIVRSFKRKAEVDLFRTVYGKAFNLISVYASAENRLKALSREIARSEKRLVLNVQHEALELINIDSEEEGKERGQNVRDTFPLADYFVAVDDLSRLKAQLDRLTNAVFGNPYITPSANEQAMFFAHAAALRSGDLSRQVGAVIVSNAGEVLALGCNEVPKAGGGLYWCDDDAPRRDLDLGHDKNAKIKQDLAEEILHRLRDAEWLDPKIAAYTDKELFEKATDQKAGFLRGSQFLDVIEYGRALHAEMSALTDAAKRGVSVQSARLFCTTFPCHICARHIVASGITEVVYVEPYPKSRTEELYDDSVAVNPQHPSPDRVNFFPFVGVAPRRYFDFFQSLVRRKNDKGEVLDWANQQEKSPSVKRFVLSYTALEELVVSGLPDTEKTRSAGAGGETMKERS